MKESLSSDSSDLAARVPALIAQWRQSSTNRRAMVEANRQDPEFCAEMAHQVDVFRLCADELDAALAAALAPTLRNQNED